MIFLNPLLPYMPDYLAYFFYGVITGLALKFWTIAKRNFFFILFFLYVYSIWLISMFALVHGQSDIRQAWFVFGFALTFIQLFFIFSIIRMVLFTPFQYAFETLTEGIQERRADRRDRERQEEREQNDRAEQERNQEIFRQEQAKREAEARANRAKQTGNGQAKSDNDRIEHNQGQQQNRPPAPPPAQERRSYEQILRLTAGWTQEDLKKAYQQESNRTHPDKWIGKPQAMQDMMEAEYKAVQEAYRRLKK